MEPPLSVLDKLETAYDIVADVPFAFHAGSTRSPPGKYTLRVPVDYTRG